MKLTHSLIPPAARPIIELTGLLVAHDEPMRAYSLINIRWLTDGGKCTYLRFKIFPDLEDWQDAARQVFAYHEDTPDEHT
jgi:hypothetical protein